MNKKLQIFISSTYIDLIEERQIAVKSILESGHIPAGMELFTANSEKQWEIIKKWIDNSDIYLLMLGGRYGSIDDKTKISYTEMEYDYAVKSNKPIFTIVFSNKYLKGINDSEITKYYETDKREYINFKSKVKNKLVKTANKIEDIDSLIPKAILEIEKNDNIQLTGWLRGDFSKIDQKFKIGELSFNEFNNTLKNKTFKIDQKHTKILGDTLSGIRAYNILGNFGGIFRTHSYKKDSTDLYFYNHICKYFIKMGLLEIKKVVGRDYFETKFTKDGIKFNQLLEKFREEQIIENI